MKKNLFLLFSIYFFVLQPLVIGVLRWQANFFRLGAINIVAIILIGLLYSTIEGDKKEHHEHEKKAEVLKEPTVSFHDHLRSVVKERKKKSELGFPTVISLLIAGMVFYMFQNTGFSLELLFSFAFVSGFIVFLLLTLIFKHRIHKKFWSLIGTKIYIILLIVGLALATYSYYTVYKQYNASFQDYIGQKILGQDRLPSDGYVFTGKWTILGTGMSDNTGKQIVSSDVFSGMTTGSDIQDETGTVLWTSTETTIPSTTTVTTTTLGNQKIMDAIIYLLQKYDIPLISKQDISFTYVSFNNPYYKEWRTAYANKMIGKTTNPSKYIVCESYIVMKWLLEKWNVPYTSSTVLNNFWAEAIKRDALNGCKKGKIVTDKTL